MADEFQVIRLAGHYELAIAISPPLLAAPTLADDTNIPEGAKFYRWATWTIGDHDAYAWNEVLKDTAMGYFSGQGMGLGGETVPDTTFASLDDVTAFLDARRAGPGLAGPPMRLVLHARLGNGPTVTPEMKALAARLLRDAADRIERGDKYGGFHFGRGDTHEGGFVITDNPDKMPV